MRNISLKAIVVVALAMMMLCATAAFADTVTYSTSGVFTSSGTNVANAGSGANTATLTFTGVPSSSASAPTFISLGTMHSSATGTGATFNDTFTLTVTQTVPSSGSQNISSPISGSITGTSSNVLLTFNITSFSIGGVTYNLDPSYRIVPLSTNNGDTTIQAGIVTPEPASLLLLGSGLLGIGGTIRRKLRMI